MPFDPEDPRFKTENARRSPCHGALVTEDFDGNLRCRYRGCGKILIKATEQPELKLEDIE